MTVRAPARGRARAGQQSACPCVRAPPPPRRPPARAPRGGTSPHTAVHPTSGSAANARSRTRRPERVPPVRTPRAHRDERYTPIHTLSARDKYAVPTDHTEREAHVRSIAAGWYQRSHSGAVSGMLTCHARAGTTRGVTLAPSSRPSCRPSSHAATRPLQQRFEGAHATRQVDIEELYELLVE